MDFVWLRQCHAMIRLEGRSPGADREEEFAIAHGIPVFQHSETGAARGGDMTPVHKFISELKSGRFDQHKREEITVENAPSPTLSKTQEAIEEWLQRQPFGLQKSWEPLLGRFEEIGELAHAHLKQVQGIRTNENHEAMGKDAIGDIFVFMTGYCITRGWSLQECINIAWGEVSKRDWSKNKDNGKADPAVEPWLTDSSNKGSPRHPRGEK